MSPRLAFAIQAAREAGTATMKYFRSGVSVEYKIDDTPVTIADREAESMLRRAIAEHFPGEAILGEEEGLTGSGSDRWVLDPIDGTKSFICGVPLFATLVSFESGGWPRIGVCYLPALGQMFAAEVGCGATCNGQPCHVSGTEALDQSMICCSAHAGFALRGLMPGLIKIAERARGTRTWCDAYGHMLVASGYVEAMIDTRVERWDMSAIWVIIREAGGIMTDLAGKEGIFDEALTSNARVHKELITVLQS